LVKCDFFDRFTFQIYVAILKKSSFSSDLFWIQDLENFHLKQNLILQTSFKSKNKLDRWQSTKRLNRKLNPRQISK